MQRAESNRRAPDIAIIPETRRKGRCTPIADSQRIAESERREHQETNPMKKTSHQTRESLKKFLINLIIFFQHFKKLLHELMRTQYVTTCIMFP